MIVRGYAWLAVLTGVVACGSDGVAVGSTEASTGNEPSPTTMPLPDPDEPCPLVGAYVPCTDDGGISGRKYCDEIDGVTKWGPCLSMTECDLLDARACATCILEDGMPTLVEDPDCEPWGTPVCPECHPAEACTCADDCWCQCPTGSGHGVTCPDGTERCTSDPYPCCDHGGLCQFTCDVWEQDCPEGEKCMAWGDQEASRWEGSACVAIAADAKAVGEPCTAPMGGFGGVDDCGPLAMCWGVDQATDQGYCVELCSGTKDAPTCDDPATDCVRRDGVVNVCAPLCHPLEQDCPTANVCVANTTRKFVCAADLSGRGGFLSDGCDTWTACNPGLACVASSQVVGCQNASCCAPLCSQAAQDCIEPLVAAGASCLGYPAGTPHSGYEDVGVCSLP